MGRQRPTFEVVGDYDFSFGSQAVEAFEQEAGATFDDAQKYTMELFLARKRHGNQVQFAALTIALSLSRQNGKSYAARWYAVNMALAGMRVLYSAHHSSTTAKMFKEMCSYFEDADNHPEIAEQVVRISRARGYESIELIDGGCIDFQTRTNAGGRGGTYDIIIVDEAQELTYDQLEALLPTISASGHEPQVIYIGTPPGPSCLGTVFKDLHDKAHSNEPGETWWLEWSVEADKIDDIDINDKNLWYETNPAMGTRIMERTVQNECDTMRPDGFARERLGWWRKISHAFETAINAEDWDACKVDNPRKDGLLVYAVKFSPDGSRGTLAACYKPKDGLPFVYVVESRSMAGGMSWFVENLTKRKDKAAQIVIDGQGNAQALNDRLLENGVPHQAIIRPKTGDVIAACASLVNAVQERQITHYGQPGLDDSATKTKKRRIGTRGGWGFESTDEADATLIESACLAYWAAMTTKRKPGRKAVVF